MFSRGEGRRCLIPKSRKDRKMWDRWRTFPGVYDKLGMLVLVFMIIASPDWSAFSQGTKEVDFLPYMVPTATELS